jgi:hypothetical protein
MTRPYTGLKEGYGGGRRPGTEHFVRSIQYLHGGRLWNNGTYGIRPVRGGTTPSVHGTGRAMDISRRAMDAARPGSSKQYALNFIRSLIELEKGDDGILEMVIDYDFEGTARIWRCDRGTWVKQIPGRISGAPGGDWYHIEISPAGADNAKLIDRFWDRFFDALKTLG